MDHNHKVEFPQFEKLKKTARAELTFNRKLYIGLAVGLFLGYLKGRSCEAKVHRVYFISP